MYRVMKTFTAPRAAALAACAALAATAAPAFAQDVPAPAAPLSPEETAVLVADVNTAINAVDTVRANFVQVTLDPATGASARGTGQAYIARPGRMRFAYAPPQEDPDLIISDGAVVRLRNAGLNCVEEFTLRATPLHIFLKDNVDLDEDAEIIAAGRTDDSAFITLADSGDEVDGTLTLRFAGPNLELREWEVVDGAGLITTTTFLNVVYGDDLGRNLFVMTGPQGRDGFRSCG